MHALAKAKRIGGSIGIIIPSDIIKNQRISIEDTLKISVERTDDISFLWGRYKHIKKPIKQIMKEIDWGELDG